MLSLEDAVVVSVLELRHLRLLKEELKMEVEILKSKLDSRYTPKSGTDTRPLQEELKKIETKLEKFNGKGYLRKDLVAEAIMDDFSYNRMGVGGHPVYNMKGAKKYRRRNWWHNNFNILGDSIASQTMVARVFDMENFSQRATFHSNVWNAKTELVISIEALKAKKEKLMKQYRKHRKRMLEKYKTL